ncbi:MAG TPA: c-type cytochrome [Myxococcaceae bacterium]|nr:c-type cytochrome [Myxococcaceae bacterium]
MRNVLIATSVAVLALCGCDGTVANKGYTNSAGSLALSRDDAFLYAIDADNELLAVVDTEAQAKVAEVKVGKLPERVAVGPDDSIYVTNRGARSVSVIRKGEWTEAARVQVGVEPVGVAVAPDNSAVYVVSSTALESSEYGTLTAFDPKSLRVKWVLPVGEEPRGIALLPDNKAVVTLFKKGEVVTVDLAQKSVLASESGIYEALNASRNTAGSPGRFGFSTFRARAMTDVVASPDGKRLFSTVTLAREDAITSTPSSLGGYYTNGGPCNIGAIASPGLLTFQANVTATPSPGVVVKGDDLVGCSTRTNSSDADYPPSAVGAPFAPFSGEAQALQGPVVAAVDSTGAWLFVVNQDTNNVAVMPTNRRQGDDLTFESTGSTVRSLVKVGAGPNGIALSRDGKRAYVYNAFDHTVSILGSQPGSRSGIAGVAELTRIRVANDVLPPDVVAGRKLFFAASDARLTNTTSGATSCHTCHREGRDDGHTWSFPDGPRQTPSLAGRMLERTAPYHWSGEFSTMNAFLEHTVRLRMGGSGLNQTNSAQLMAYIATLPGAENPNHLDTPTEAQLRGARVFEAAKCGTCHGGEALTDNTFADVGTFVRSGANPDHSEVVAKGLNVPTLLGIARTAPFLHDGSAPTLRDRLMRDRATNKHGETAALSDADMDDLVEYLKSL